MPTVIRICHECLEYDKVLAAARDLKIRHGNKIVIELVDCMDQCHYPPAVMVNDRLIIWGDAGKLRDAVLQAMTEQVG